MFLTRLILSDISLMTEMACVIWRSDEFIDLRCAFARLKMKKTYGSLKSWIKCYGKNENELAFRRDSLWKELWRSKYQPVVRITRAEPDSDTRGQIRTRQEGVLGRTDTRRVVARTLVRERTPLSADVHQTEHFSLKMNGMQFCSSFWSFLYSRWSTFLPIVITED